MSGYVVFDSEVYDSAMTSSNAFYTAMIRGDRSTGVYIPLTYLSDFWVLMKELTKVGPESDKRTVTIRAGTQSKSHYGYQRQFLMSIAKQQEWGVVTDADMDEYKRIWKETDPILLTVTFVVSLLHMFFEWMAFKSDIQFWRAKESVEGISVRSLYVELVMQVVIQLYFMDNQTSLLVMIPHLLSIPLTLWKISQAVRVEKSQSFPFFKLEHKASYANTTTKEFDRQAMTYMSYALYPGLAVYSVYSFMYNQHKSTYSYVLNTLVGTIYVFGFIEMTP